MKTQDARRRRTAPAARLAVDEEQRRHLIRCCAFFRAQRFRDAAPDEIRSQDVAAAAAQINSAIGDPVRKKKR
jgi:hypothetical protein